MRSMHAHAGHTRHAPEKLLPGSTACLLCCSPSLCAQVEARLRQLEGKQLATDSAKPRGLPGAEKYDSARQGAAAALLSQPKAYNADADVTADAGKKKKKVGWGWGGVAWACHYTCQ